MTKFSNWDAVEPLIEPPRQTKIAIQQKVMARLSMARFIGSVVDLYVNKAGETLIGLANTFEESPRETDSA